MDLGLAGKVAAVAAGTRGLGRAVAIELVKEGCAVTVCGRDREQLAATVRELERFGAAAGDAVDLRDSGAAEAFVRRVVDRHGAIDILINNAGGPPSGAFLDLDDAAWEGAFRLNLVSTVAMTRAAVPTMKAKRWGRIINITSASVKQPIDGLMLSNSLRLGVVGFAKTLSRELAPFGITVNNVCPGYTRTDRVVSLARSIASSTGRSEQEVVAAWESEIPAGRLGTPEELAAVVAFLASARASYVTGASVQVDGGYVRGIG